MTDVPTTFETDTPSSEQFSTSTAGPLPTESSTFEPSTRSQTPKDSKSSTSIPTEIPIKTSTRQHSISSTTPVASEEPTTDFESTLFTDPQQSSTSASQSTEKSRFLDIKRP